MYPRPDLIRLAGHKAALRRRIAARRAECDGLVIRVLQPLAWLDRGAALWRRVSPFARYAVIPLALMLKHRLAPRPRLLGSLVRWAPLVIGALRAHAASRRPQT